MSTRDALLDAAEQLLDADGVDAGTLREVDPERIAALLRATAHGAADLAIGGHLSPDGKGTRTQAS